MNQIRGHSVFSIETVRPRDHKVEGLSGYRITSMKDLDDKVDGMSDTPTWLADFEAIRKRREKE